MLAPLESRFKYGKTFRLLNGDTYVRIWSNTGTIPSEEVSRIYLRLREHFEQCDLIEEGDTQVNRLFEPASSSDA